MSDSQLDKIVGSACRLRQTEGNTLDLISAQRVLNTVIAPDAGYFSFQ